MKQSLKGLIGILPITFVLFLSPSHPLNATPSKHRMSFSRATTLTKLAIKHSDLNAFLRLCTRSLMLEESLGRHPSSDEERNSAREDFPINSKFKNDHTGFSNSATCMLDLDRPLSRQDQRLLKGFFGTICEAVKERGGSVEAGLNIVGEGVDGEDLFGPALEGEVLADVTWRLGFENVSRRWEIRSIIVAYDG